MSALRIGFLAIFMGGLVLAVFAMLHGVEHMRRNRSRAPSPFFNLPAVAALAVGFGAAGYPLATRTTWPAWLLVLVAALVGALAASAMILLLARWALRADLEHSVGEEEEIQGHLAIVSSEIAIGQPGEISYEQMGQQLKISARALGDKALPVGAEVVIDRIEEGVALVEEWSVVEQRL
jgi:membrane protein implicated in regulation of membrane protease activity